MAEINNIHIDTKCEAGTKLFHQQDVATTLVPWIWIFFYFILVIIILFKNDALKLSTYFEFTKKFKILVDEMAVSSVFRPCGYPLDLVGFCLNKFKTK